MLLLDPFGCPVNACFLAAAEWVGIETSVDAHGATVRFAPGGLTHALDPADDRLEGGATMTSSITKEAAAELGLAVDKPVVVVVKASDVMIGVE